MVRVLISLWIGACSLAMSAPGASAEVVFDATVNRDTLTVGDPVLLSLRIRREPGDAAVLLQSEGFLAPFEVRRQVPPAVRETSDGRIEETLALELAVYRVGAIEVPSLVLQVRTSEGDSGLIASEPISVLVRSVKPAEMTDIRDVKPPVDIEAEIPGWLWFAAAILVGIAAGTLWYLKRRRRKPEVEPPPPPIVWPDEVAKILRMQLVEKGAFKRYYSLLSEVMRRYLEVRVQVDAMECTTSELVQDLRRVPIGEVELMALEGLLSEADLVKFAKLRPRDEVATKAAETVLDLMRRLDAQRRESDDENVNSAPAEATA
jgi:hypothetical protein